MLVTQLIAAIDASHVDRKYQLGSLTYYNDATYGAQVYRYVRNDSGGAIAANLGVMQENGTALHEVVLSGAATARPRLLGKTIAAVPATYYAWVLADGFGLLTSNGSTTANVGQMCVASGQFADGLIGTNEIVASACAAQAAPGGTFVGRISAL